MPVKHRPEITQNANGSWNYRCVGCKDSKKDLKSEATGRLAFRAHMASLKHTTR